MEIGERLILAALTASLTSDHASVPIYPSCGTVYGVTRLQ
jgi:hypothetical protein